MSTFKDIANREYIVLITVGAAEDVRNRVLDQNKMPVDLFGIVQSGNITVFTEDIPLLVNVLYVLLEDQVEKFGMDQKQFGRSLAGPQIEAATSAFLEALINFSQSPRQREMLQKIISKNEELQTKAMEKALTKIDTLAVEMVPEIEKELDKVTVQTIMEQNQKEMTKKVTGKSSTIVQES